MFVQRRDYFDVSCVELVAEPWSGNISILLWGAPLASALLPGVFLSGFCCVIFIAGIVCIWVRTKKEER